MQHPPSSARVVVIGGGIGGVSAAYHLAMLGVRDVQVLERAELGSGTTWHSTGNMETYRADPLIFEMVRYAAEIYPRIAVDSGQDIGWRVVGRVMYTDRAERWDVMRTLPELGRARGIDIELLSPGLVARRLPIIDSSELLGGIWVPSDARVNPSDAVQAFARLARSRGVVIRERCRALGVTVKEGSVRGVVTDAGDIACEAVIVAAGLWSAELLKSCGARLPLHALEHQYLITKPFGVDRNMPLFLSFDDQLYGREEVGGIIVGSLDDEAIAIPAAALPGDFCLSLLNERWDQFEPYMATALRRFPALRTAGVKMLLNGPESFTPDGQMLLGPIAGTSGLYAACGFNSNGMALAPAAGRYIAEWIVEGAAGADVAALDVRRFSAVQSSEAYIRERVTEVPGYQCRIRSPGEDYHTARGIRRSPVHEELAAAGARFASVSAWERAAWFDRGSRELSWLKAVEEETAAAFDRVMLIDHSADVKYLLVGAGVCDWMASAAVPLAGGASDAMTVALPGAHDQVEVLARVIARQHDRCMLTAGPEQETRLAEWLRRAQLPAHVRAVDQTAAYACLELTGPRRNSLLRALGAPAEPGVRWAGACRIDEQQDLVNDSTVLLVSSEFAVYLWRRLIALGADFDLKIGGHLAEEAVRIGRGVPAFGREVSPAMLVGEIRASEGGDDRTDARIGVPRTHRGRVLAAFSSPMTVPGFGAHDVILEAGRAVGELTSRVLLPGWSTAWALGVLDRARWQGAGLTAVADGRLWPLDPRSTRWQAALRNHG